MEKKKIKEDLVGIALTHLAVESNKKTNSYTEALLDYVSKGKSKKFRDNAENWIWELVFEEISYEEFKSNISDFKESK
jgi:hypothetical protein